MEGLNACCLFNGRGRYASEWPRSQYSFYPRARVWALSVGAINALLSLSREAWAGVLLGSGGVRRALLRDDAQRRVGPAKQLPRALANPQNSGSGADFVLFRENAAMQTARCET